MDRRPDVLRLCARIGGFSAERFFQEEADRAVQEGNDEMVRAIEETGIRQWPRRLEPNDPAPARPAYQPWMDEIPW